VKPLQAAGDELTSDRSARMKERGLRLRFCCVL
jgi:hypothetical protein